MASSARLTAHWIDAINGDGRADCDREQQESGRGDESSPRGFAPAPAPDFLGVADGPGVNRFVAEEAVEVVGQFLRRLVAAGRLFLQAFQADRFQVGRHAGIEQARRDRFRVHHFLQACR